MHAYYSLNRLDYPLSVANEIAVDLLRRQVLDHTGQEPREMQYPRCARLMAERVWLSLSILAIRG